MSKIVVVSWREVFNAAEVFFLDLGVKEGDGSFLAGAVCMVEGLVSVFPLSVC